MVNPFFFGAVLIAVAPQIAFAGAQCTKGSEFDPPLCRLTMPYIVRVTIEENAAKSSLEKEPSVDCSDFALTQRLVRRYFSRAKRVPAGTGHATLDWSACYASGTLLLKNGRSARWAISQFRVGSLVLDGQPEQTLYCPTCKDKPFVW